MKKILTLLLLILLSGCSTVVEHFDATWDDKQTTYNKSQPLPPLEIPPELGKISPS